MSDQSTIKDPITVLADRLSALDETGLRHFAYALAYAPDVNLALLRSKVGEAEQWSAKIAQTSPPPSGGPDDSLPYPRVKAS